MKNFIHIEEKDKKASMWTLKECVIEIYKASYDCHIDQATVKASIELFQRMTMADPITSISNCTFHNEQFEREESENNETGE